MVLCVVFRFDMGLRSVNVESSLIAYYLSTGFKLNQLFKLQKKKPV